MKYFLAVDIGASSGRHFITWKNENDELEYKEIFRFKNGLEKRNSHLCWNLEGLCITTRNFWRVVNPITK